MYRIKKDSRSEQSARMICDALRALVAEGDFHSITVCRLAERAGVGRSTFYRTFDGIEDVLQLLCDQRFQELTGLMQTEYETALSSGSMRRVNRLFLEYWYRDSEIIELLLHAERFDILLASFGQMFRTLNEPHIRAFGAPTRLLEYLQAAWSGAVMSMLVQWILNGKDIPPDEMANLLEETLQQVEKNTSFR